MNVLKPFGRRTRPLVARKGLLAGDSDGLRQREAPDPSQTPHDVDCGLVPDVQRHVVPELVPCRPYPPKSSAKVSAMTSVALKRSASGRRSSARWALASSIVCGPAP